MRLHSFIINGFRKHIDTTIQFSNTTFLIGENNVGKSSVLNALNYLLTDKKQIPTDEYSRRIEEDGEEVRQCDKIILTAEFRNVPQEALLWRGFKGRIFRYEPTSDEDSGLSLIYRKKYPFGGNCLIEMKEFSKTLKEEFVDCKSIQDYIDNGANIELIREVLPNFEEIMTKRITKDIKEKIDTIDELYNFGQEEVWINNPGGIPGVVLSKLPKFILIPAQDKVDELSGNSGALHSTLNELFGIVRDESPNYRIAQEHLDKLAKELDPSDQESEFGKMLMGLNHVLSDVFPNSGIQAEALLSDADKVIKPQFSISMFSNVATSISLQGTGMIRAAVFALLRYKNSRDLQKEREGGYIRPLLIGFEEPEIYLHPNAANQMRETIYSLADQNNNQIICTTHSPYMIDLSKKPLQVLNRLTNESGFVDSLPFNIAAAYKELLDDNKDYLKMILKIDDSISRIFFAKNVLIVEGDTEEIVFRETINRLPLKRRKEIKNDWQIVRARGKATIISLIKYFKGMGIIPYVMHDKDTGVAGAEVFNDPIKNALNDDSRLIVLENCIEDVLGYQAPSSEKPYNAYKFINQTWSEDIPENWLQIVSSIFEIEEEKVPAEV